MIGSNMKYMKDGENSKVIPSDKLFEGMDDEPEIGLEISETRLKKERSRLQRDYNLMISHEDLKELMTNITLYELHEIKDKIRESEESLSLIDLHRMVDMNQDGELLIGSKLRKLNDNEKKIILTVVWYEFGFDEDEEEEGELEDF